MPTPTSPSGRRFGTPEIHPYIPKRDDDHPEIVVIDTVGGGAEFWHTDVTFSPTPPMASILQMVMNPPRGGDTLFTNQYLVYEIAVRPDSRTCSRASPRCTHASAVRPPRAGRDASRRCAPIPTPGAGRCS